MRTPHEEHGPSAPPLVAADPPRYLFDALLTLLDEARGQLSFTVGDDTHRVETPHAHHWIVGAVGRLRLAAPDCPFAFHQYADQRLRRAPELDDLTQGRLGWQLGARRFTAPAHLLPGRNGHFIPRDTESQVLDLPREYLAFCKAKKLNPRTVIMGFVADLCELQNLFANPREDGYASHGSDERGWARSYFERVYGKVAKTGVRKTPLKRQKLRQTPAMAPINNPVEDKP
jgi:hypothetical protein